MDLKKHVTIALVYFFIVTLLGVLLRSFFVTPIALNYKYILHAHSHTALLGWIYLGLTTLIYKIFLTEAQKPKLYKRIFLVSNFCILGMLVTFPIQGYALFSITFSTLFLIVTYWFTWFALKYVTLKFKNRFSWKLIKTSLYYLVISSIGPWAIGVIMATLGTGSIWYKTAIYFYLHFQYNGWFIITLLGILFFILEEKGFQFDRRKLGSIFIILNIGVVFTAFLSGLWFSPPLVFYVLGLFGALTQGLAFYELYLLLRNELSSMRIIFEPKVFYLLKIAGILLCAKLLLQVLSAIPYVADLAYQLKDFIIGYLHLVFLGVVITSLIAFLQYFKLIRLPKSFLWFYLFAFITTEALIFYKAIVLWFGIPFFQSYYTYLFVFSCFFPVAIGILLFTHLNGHREN
tara:strand:+ start:61674 stop:62882 length:1209 start_codon:yes stop_codon:yes gene_type:complete